MACRCFCCSGRPAFSRGFAPVCDRHHSNCAFVHRRYPAIAAVAASKNPPKVPVASPSSIPDRSLTRRAASPETEPPPSAPAPEPEPSNAITLPLDLSSYADAAARRQSEKEAIERRRRNLAGPQDSQLEWSRNNVPLVRDYHQRNDTEHAEGGELIVWMNDKCFYTNRGITTFGLPQTSMVCKDPPKPETELFKDMRKKLDEGAKGSAP